MFNPSNVSNAKAEKAAKKKALAELKVQSEALIPQELHEGEDVMQIPEAQVQTTLVAIPVLSTTYVLIIILISCVSGLLVDVAEVACGDPTCAPIDTVFTLVWQSGGKGVFALPMLASEVTKDDLIDAFPVSLSPPLADVLQRASNRPFSHHLPSVPCRMKIFCASGTPARKPGGPGFPICVSKYRTAWNAALALTL